MSNLQCSECGTILIDGGKGVGYKTLQQIQLEELQEKCKPFSDEYFRNLTYEQIAELAKKSLRLTKEHCSDLHKIKELEEQLAAYTDALIEISNNDQCVCSLDDTCQPQRIAMRVLADFQGGKNDGKN